MRGKVCKQLPRFKKMMKAATKSYKEHILRGLKNGTFGFGFDLSPKDRYQLRSVLINQQQA